MTEKNADVEWLRGALSMMAPRPGQRVSLSRKQAESILAHIDQLEAEVLRLRRVVEADDETKTRLRDRITQRDEELEALNRDALRRDLCNEPEPDRRPTVHEIAAQMMAAMILGNTRRDEHSSDGWNTIFARYADLSYRAAVALVADGRRRDGL